MKVADSRNSTLTACVASAMLAACNSASPFAAGPPGPAQASGQPGVRAHSLAYWSSLITSEQLTPSAGSGNGRSWMRRDAKKSDLLYVGDTPSVGSGVVDIYNYKNPNVNGLLGQLTGFSDTDGLCSDSAGNVYITNEYANEVVEYAKGGTDPIKTFKVGRKPVGCSVDPTTGNLAVSAIAGTYGPGSCGSVWIFPQGKNAPATLYRAPNICHYFPPGYDDKGILYVEGTNGSMNATGMAKLPEGSRRFKKLALSGFTIGFPGNVMWSGNYLAAFDLNYKGTGSEAMYNIMVEGSTATLVSTTVLSFPACAAGSGNLMWVMGKKIVGGPVNGDSCLNQFYYWNSLEGGDPKKTISPDIAPAVPTGETVSR
jgi:hypothetical protein